MNRFEARMESPLRRSVSFAFLGMAVGLALAVAFNIPVYLVSGELLGGVLVSFPLGGFVGGFVIALVGREGVGGLVERASGGTRGRSKKEYSQAQALVLRGAYQDAVNLYDEAARESPTDPEPLIRGARVLRDELRRHDEAAAWFRRAARIPQVSKEAEITIVRELVELLDGPLGRPAEALPELARIENKYAGTRAGDWARTRHARIRDVVWQDLKGEES